MCWQSGKRGKHLELSVSFQFLNISVGFGAGVFASFLLSYAAGAYE